MTDYSDRKGDWIITHGGRRFYPLDPRPEDIDIYDIAHSLSLLNRFTGHSRFPFSVAQHSIDVALVMLAENDTNVCLSGLLHNASEAYVNDLARPLKRMLPDYTTVENKILDVIDEKFGVKTRHPVVKEADSRCFVTEAAQLCVGEPWYLELQWPRPFSYAVYEQPWRQVQKEFIAMYNQLGGTRD